MNTIDVQRATPSTFAPYGHVAARPAGEPLASDEQFSYWSDVAAFDADGAVEIGYCTVRRRREERIGWMERHAMTPEVLVPTDGAIVLPVMQEGVVAAFRIEPGQAVVIARGVWHSACIPAAAEEATYLVLFRRGTPAHDVIKREIDAVTVRL